MLLISLPGIDIKLVRKNGGQFLIRFEIKTFEGALSYFSSQYYLNRAGNDWSDVQNTKMEDRLIMGEIKFHCSESVMDFINFTISNHLHMQLIDEENSKQLYDRAVAAVNRAEIVADGRH